MDTFILIILIPFLNPTATTIVQQPVFDQQEDSVFVRSVDIQQISDGWLGVTVTFTATSMPHLLWEIGGKPVLYYDTSLVSFSSYNSATLHVTDRYMDQMIRLSIILSLFQENVVIRLSHGSIGQHLVANHTLVVSPCEGLTYSTEEVGRVIVDARSWLDGDMRYSRPVVKGMVIIPDYCSRPVRVLLGYPSSNPDMLKITTAEESSVSTAVRFHITSISKQFQKQGMLIVSSEFVSRSDSDVIRSVNTIRRIFFKPASFFGDYFIRNAVMLIGWQHSLIVDLYSDADYHVYAIGSPAPRIMLARNGNDLSMIVERRDIEKAYFKHVIFRFRNVTQDISGRYICTAVSGGGRTKHTFTLYVRSPCNTDI